MLGFIITVLLMELHILLYLVKGILRKFNFWIK